MQLIAEIYDILRRGIGLSVEDIADLFTEWNTGELNSYLIQITAEILRRIDGETGQALVDVIRDEAAQTGTGIWASQQALDVGAPIPTINAAVESRILSSLKSQRVEASQSLPGPDPKYHGDSQRLIEAARQALYASKITSYEQGFGMLNLASSEFQYSLSLGEIAKIWRAGCIIRAGLLNDIMSAYQGDPGLVNLMLAQPFREILESRQPAWRLLVQTAIGCGIPVMALSASLAYFDAYRSERLPANLIQAQRDYFGSLVYFTNMQENHFPIDKNRSCHGFPSCNLGISARPPRHRTIRNTVTNW